jgi:hypothetical protein
MVNPMPVPLTPSCKIGAQALERLEHRAALARRDAGATVFDDDAGVTLPHARCGCRSICRRWRIYLDVGEQIAEDLLDGVSIRLESDRAAHATK